MMDQGSIYPHQSKFRYTFSSTQQPQFQNQHIGVPKIIRFLRVHRLPLGAGSYLYRLTQHTSQSYENVSRTYQLEAGLVGWLSG